MILSSSTSVSLMWFLITKFCSHCDINYCFPPCGAMNAFCLANRSNSIINSGRRGCYAVKTSYPNNIGLRMQMMKSHNFIHST
jgi:hypothetical protein